MKALKQMLCRPMNVLNARIWVLLAMLWLTGAGLDSQAAPRNKVAAAPEAKAAVPPEVTLRESVKSWVASQRRVPADSVEVAAFDPRLKVQACDGPLQMDTPFSSQDAVRVRCAQPAWQLYTQVAVKPGTVVLAATAPRDARHAAQPPQRKMLVAAMVLPRGTVLTEAHVMLVDADTSIAASPAFEKVHEILHAEVIRDLRPGMPIRSQDVRPTVLVRRGQMVLMTVGQNQGFQISARVEAMQDGRMGEQIQLRNKESGRVLSGVVKGPNTVLGL